MHNSPEEFDVAIAAFNQVVNSLARPFTVTNIHGFHQLVPALVDQMDGGGTVIHSDILTSWCAGSSVPVWIPGIDWKDSILTAIAHAGINHHPPRRVTVAQALAWCETVAWTPADTLLLRDATMALADAHRVAMWSIFPAIFTLKSPCPCCHVARVVCNRYGNEVIYLDALQVHEIFAECRGCGHRWWGMDMITGLARDVAAHHENTPEPMMAGA